MSKKKRKISNQIYMYKRSIYMEKIFNLFMSRFKFEGMPDSVSTRYLMKELFYKGKAVFFYNKNTGTHQILGVNDYGRYNQYGDPIKCRAYGYGGAVNMNLTIDNSVIIYLKPSRMNFVYMVEDYIDRIVDVETTIKINTKQQRLLTVFRGTEKQRLTLENLINQWQEGQETLIIDNNMNLDTSNILVHNVPYNIDKLQSYKNQLWNELLTSMGINNSNTEKKERMLSNEIDSNNELIGLSLNVELMEIRSALEKINKMFKLNISVEDTFKQSEFIIEGKQKEGDSNE